MPVPHHEGEAVSRKNLFFIFYFLKSTKKKKSHAGKY